jgi:hypothetical protein
MIEARDATELALAVAYLTLGSAWPSAYCARVEPWLRAQLGRRLGVTVLRRAPDGPYPASPTWTIHPGQAPAKERIVGAAATTASVAGALVPAGALATMLLAGGLSQRTGAALVPLSLLLILLFLHRLNRVPDAG